MYTVTQMYGGGPSWWYLMSPGGSIVMAVHQDRDGQLAWVNAVAGLLNTTLAGEPEGDAE